MHDRVGTSMHQNWHSSSPTAAPLAVAECLGRLKGEPCVYEGIVELRDNSRIHRALWGSRSIAVKECFDLTRRHPDPTAAEREFSALTSLTEATSASGTPPLAPIPLALCREHAIYAMTWIAGRPATSLMLARTTDIEQAGMQGAAAGHWLRRLHGLRPLPSRRSDFEEKASSVEEIPLADQGRDPLIRRAAASLLSHASAAAAQLMPASWIHGDMKTDNLLVDGDRVTGLDVHLSHENTVVYDLAPFLNHLHLLRWTPRGLWQTNKLMRVAEAFLNAYSAEAVGWNVPIAWLRSYLLIQLLDPSRNTGSLHEFVQRRTIRSELTRAIGDLERGR